MWIIGAKDQYLKVAHVTPGLALYQPLDSRLFSCFGKELTP